MGSFANEFGHRKWYWVTQDPWHSCYQHLSFIGEGMEKFRKVNLREFVEFSIPILYTIGWTSELEDLPDEFTFEGCEN
jgi:hypothetical protein